MLENVEPGQIVFYFHQGDQSQQILFYARSMDIRKLARRQKTAIQLIFSFSTTVFLFISKAEKGVNLADYAFMNRINSVGKIYKNYNGIEKYRHYLPALVTVYQKYHKEINLAEADRYFLSKLSIRKPNRSADYDPLRNFLQNKLPILRFLPFTEKTMSNTNVMSKVSEIMVEMLHRREEEDWLTGGVLFAFLLDVSGTLMAGQEYYYQKIVSNAQVSLTRKHFETKQYSISDELDRRFGESSLPVNETDLLEFMNSHLNDLNSVVFEGKTDLKISKLKFGMVFGLLDEYLVQFLDNFSNTFQKNLDISKDRSNRQIEELINDLPGVDDLDEETLESDSLFENLQQALLQLLEQYYETNEGPYKHEIISEKMVPYILDYMNTLHVRSTSSMRDQNTELKERLSNTLSNVEFLKESLENQENEFLENKKFKEDFELNLKQREMDIDRLKSKAILDQEVHSQKIARIEKDMDCFRNDIRAQKEENEDLKTKVREDNDRIRNLVSENSDLQERLREAERVTYKGFSGREPLDLEDSSMANLFRIAGILRDQNQELKLAVDHGFSKRTQKLNESIIDKDQHLFSVLEDKEAEIRKVKSDSKRQLRTQSAEYEQEIENIQERNRTLLEENFKINEEILSHKAEVIKNQRNVKKLEESQELINELETNRNTKKNLVSEYQKTIENFVKQVEQKEKDKYLLESRINKSTKESEKMKYSKENLVIMFKLMLAKFIKKKNGDLKGAFETLDSKDREMVMSIAQELKINLQKYV